MTIIGGLIVSQVLTLYTTPVIYLCSTGCTSGSGAERRCAIRGACWPDVGLAARSAARVVIHGPRIL